MVKIQDLLDKDFTFKNFGKSGILVTIGTKLYPPSGTDEYYTRHDSTSQPASLLVSDRLGTTISWIVSVSTYRKLCKAFGHNSRKWIGKKVILSNDSPFDSVTMEGEPLIVEGQDEIDATP